MFLLIFKFAGIAVAIFFILALGLIASQRARPAQSEKTLDFAVVRQAEQPEIALQTLEAGDGTKLGYRYLPAKNPDAPLFVFIHGSGWHGQGYLELAHAVHGEGDVAVALPDLRGHGPNPERRGDVDYIGQFEDDIAELVGKLRQPGQRFILGGHSSGGGLVIRYAGGRHGKDMDQAVLIAPYLKHDAPTIRTSSGWAKPLIARIIGLKLLNLVGIKAFNYLPVVLFNFPARVLESPLGSTATTQYSYRLNESFAPRSDYLGDVAKLPSFLLISGRNDEAFKAELYEPTLAEATDKGRYVLLDNVGHLDVTSETETARLIREFILKDK